MEPFPTKAEVSLRQRICHEAWELSLSATGIEKMKLIAEAHPYAVDRSNAEGSLHIHWHPRLSSYMICDFSGFITMIPEDEPDILIEAIKLEFHQRGAFRESITGEKAEPLRMPPKKFVRTQKIHIKLGDLGL